MNDISKSKIVDSILKNIRSFESKYDIREIGVVRSIKDGVAEVVGLNNAGINEVVEFDCGIRGLVLNLKEDVVDVVLLEKYADVLSEGSEVKRTKQALSVPVGMQLLGRVVDSMGLPIDGKGEFDMSNIEYAPIETPAPSIFDRQSVHEPLQTGIKIIDALIPIGRGQRELIIGDRQTGKTSIAIDTIINQAQINKTKKYDSEKVFCVYVAIGQKQSTVARIIKMLEDHDAMQYTVIVTSNASQEAMNQFLAPYTGCAIGEYFRDNGMHALVVYDDLTKHAIAYRQVSLLLRRPPGREAYPGDVFYIHSRLLERAAKLSEDKKSGSLTALPIIETQGGDISAYVPTNVISITDGQIFLEADLFFKGFRPAVNIGLSVSRVGSAAQYKAIKKVAGRLKLDFAQYKELESFAKFGSDLDQTTRDILNKGDRISASLIQKNMHVVSFVDQVIILFCASRNLFSKVDTVMIPEFLEKLIIHVKSDHENIISYIENTKDISEEIIESMEAVITEFLNTFINAK